MRPLRAFAVFTLLSALPAACAQPAIEAPEVLGLRFGESRASIASYMPLDSTPITYPVLGFTGFKLSYPNPENWTVFVTDDAPDVLAERRIYSIALTKDLGTECVRATSDSVAQIFQTKYAPQFAETHMISEAEDRASVLSLSPGRMLTVQVSCYLESVLIHTVYLDSNLFRYRKPAQIDSLIQLTQREFRSYRARTLTPGAT